MSKPLITELYLLDEKTDDESRLSQNYKVIGTNLNVENVKTATSADGTLKLPQKGDPNPYLSANNATVVSKVTVSGSGTLEAGAIRTFKVAVTYATQDEASESKNDPESPDSYRFPWDRPAKIAISNDTTTVDLWGVDGAGQNLQYSNGEPVNLTVEHPLTVINIQRANRLDIANNGIDLNRTFFQRVNNNAVEMTIGGQTSVWQAGELLCSGVDVEPDLFTYFDPITRKLKSIPYAMENITLVGNTFKWVTRVMDQGNFGVWDKTNTNADGKWDVVDEIAVSNGIKRGPFLLNGKGQILLSYNSETGATGEREIKHAYEGNAETAFGVSVDTDAMNKAFPGGTYKAVFLKFLTYEAIDFTNLRINERLP